MRTFHHRKQHPYLFLCVIVLLSFLAGMLDTVPVHAANPGADRKEFFNADGTLKLDGSFSGPLDLQGWNVKLDPRRGPVFTPAQATFPQGWSGLGADMFGEGVVDSVVRAVAIDGTNVYIGGDFKNVGTVLTAADYIARWDGTNWSALGSNGAGNGALNNTVNSIVVMGTDLYVGGAFTNVNNNGELLDQADYLARWDGMNWSPVRAGDGWVAFNGVINAMAASEDSLYVVGNFTDLYDHGTTLSAADYIAKWDGTNWFALGSNGAGNGSLSGAPVAIAVDGNDIYVGGPFSNVNDNGTLLPAAAHIARWDGTGWSALGSNGAGGPALNNTVYAIAADNGTVYAGGAFTDVKNNGVLLPAADYIAMWDGTNWSSLGSYMTNYGSLTSPVRAIAVNGTNVYVGGDFRDVRENTKILYETDRIARWDGTNWFALGSDGVGGGSLNGAVLNIAIDQRTVFAAGSFTEANNNGTILKNAANVAAFVEETPPPATPSFADVSTGHPYYRDIEILYANNLTGGCQASPLKFCPEQAMNRAQAAAFMLRGSLGSSYVPDPPTHVFKDDWTKGAWAEAWAEGMRSYGLSAGCLTGPLKYCPWDQIPREQAVIFALKLKYGQYYAPPSATGTVFADMSNPNYYATAWAEQAFKEGIIPGCERYTGRYFCPKDLVTRGLAAHMIVRAKGLNMP